MCVCNMIHVIMRACIYECLRAHIYVVIFHICKFPSNDLLPARPAVRDVLLIEVGEVVA